MRARQNLFFEKVPFLENKKVSKQCYFKVLNIFEYNIGIPKKFFIFKKLFCPLDFFEVMDL